MDKRLTDIWKNEHPEVKITDILAIYSQNAPLYEYASEFWDGKVRGKSLCRAIRFALNTKEAPNDYDPFESLVDSNLYLVPEKCGMIWDEKKEIYKSNDKSRPLAG